MMMFSNLCLSLLLRTANVGLGVCLAAVLAVDAVAGERELIQDPHFQKGFYLLEPKPGKRAVYAELPGFEAGHPSWDLAQWSSRFPLRPGNCRLTDQFQVCSNSAKTVRLGKPDGPESDLSLGVNAGSEYVEARKSTTEPWVHLLVQQEFVDPPALASLDALNFHLEARLTASRLVSTNDYSPLRHAAQFLVYLTVANRNPKSIGYQECFWFGVPIYDNRYPIVPAYEAQDFGDTKLFIFTPSSDAFALRSTHDRSWVTFQKELLPLIRQGLARAHAKGFIKGSPELTDYRTLGIFIGWEVPGRFDVELQARNLSLKAVTRE